LKGLSERKIDVFTHILPPKYKAALEKKAKPSMYMNANNAHSALWDLDIRFAAMSRFEGLAQVLTLAPPPLEYALNPRDASDLARMANDQLADLAARYPDQFVAAVACLPMNDVDTALKETDRAIKELHLKGVQIFTPANGRAVDRPEFMALYQKLQEHDLPIWIHPSRDTNVPDYCEEGFSRYMLSTTLGWPYETSLAMARLVFSGVLERFPNLKFVTHHAGDMIPFFEQRIARRVVARDDRSKPEHTEKLEKPPIEYFRKFYADTAIAGNTAGLTCALSFFGPTNLVFGTDYPYGENNGLLKVEQTIGSVESMNLSSGDQAKIFHENTERILRLPK
jgi:uncharacterized protein